MPGSAKEYKLYPKIGYLLCIVYALLCMRESKRERARDRERARESERKRVRLSDRMCPGDGMGSSGT